MDKRSLLKLSLGGRRDLCAFDIANQLNIKIVYTPNFPSIVGFYKSTDRECVFINESLDRETQEQANFYLVYHALYHKDVDLMITEKEFIRLERASRFSIIDFFKNNRLLSEIISWQ